MPKIIDPRCESLIKAFPNQGFSSRAVCDKLKEVGFIVTKTTVPNVLKNVGIGRQATLKGEKPPPRRNLKKIRKKALVKKVENLVNKENPKSQRNIAKLCGTSQSTIWTIIQKDLQRVTRRKIKVHSLKPSHIPNRKTTARNLYEKRLAGQRSSSLWMRGGSTYLTATGRERFAI